MRVRAAMDMANKMKHNQFPDEILTRWLNECEGRIQVEVHQIAPDQVLRYDIPGDDETEMLVPFPYDRLYWQWLLAMIDFAHGEYSSYQNSMQAVNQSIKEYHAWYMRNRHTCTQ